MSTKQTDPVPPLLTAVSNFFKDRFNLDDDKARRAAVVEEINRGVSFRGPNLWILMFAILICSIGLNVNSTAVIIGAMLISPLMGPIMGIGLGIGINDFELIIKGFRNLGIAVGISILVSAIYFWVSPLKEEQSELLARINPTLWDVLIAVFGGLAGIVAGSRKEKSNAIPGVAIATALMPPLCTAGFGLATLQWNYFAGALYLFFINSVFISLSTYLIVRALRYRPKQFIDAAQELRVKRYIAFLVVLTIIPATYTAFKTVQKSFFESSANLFVNEELKFENCTILKKEITFEGDYLFGKEVRKKIEVTLLGRDSIPQEKLDDMRSHLARPKYKLADVELVINQEYFGNGEVDYTIIDEKLSQNRNNIIEDLYKNNAILLRQKEDTIRKLRNQIVQLHSRQLPVIDITEELKTQHERVTAFSLTETILTTTDSLRQDTVHLAYVKFTRLPGPTERRRLTNWLKVKTDAKNLKVIVE